MKQSASDRSCNLHAGLIIAGAAAKGPFAAGALTRLSRDDRFQITSVAGASSGALNGAVYAAGLRVNQAARAAELLEQLWLSRASVPNIVRWRDRVAIVRQALAEFSRHSTERQVRFRAVLASLSGELDRFGRVRFEHAEDFESEDFRDERRLEHMAKVCVASAALPLIFKPRRVGGSGPFWDGGIVDNAPIGWAVRDQSIDRIIVITPDSQQPMNRRYSRFAVLRLIHMLIDERLGRDLYEAESFNQELLELRKRLIDLQGAQGERLADDLLCHLRWRQLTLVEIRPERELRGNVLSGFLSQRERRAHIEAGHDAAEYKLKGWVAAAQHCPPDMDVAAV